MSTMRKAVEFLYWAGLERDEIFNRLNKQYELTPEYVDEVCTMMENDDYLLEE